jgi:hypothetical protein
MFRGLVSALKAHAPETTEHEKTSANAEVLRTGAGPCVSVNNLSAPRGGLNLNRGFVELGSYALNRLGRKPIIEFYAWNTAPVSKQESNDPGKPGRDPLRLARYYRSLLETGKLESRAALARFLGVTRARVTQVLNRLNLPSHITSSASEFRPEGAAG